MVAGMTVPQFAFPFSLVGDDFAYTEQDSQAEIADCLKVLLLTPVGSRDMLPAYGVPPLFQGQVPVVTAETLAAIQRWGPRAYASLDEYLNPNDAGQDIIDVTVAGGSNT